MQKWSKTELKLANKEKIRCKKTYEDWVDDEFNCGCLKFIFGVTDNPLIEHKANFTTLNNLQIYYNRDTKKYLLDLECCDLHKISYLHNLLNEFQSFMQNEENINVCNFEFLDTSMSKFINNNMSYWIADSLEELYYKFFVFVNGYSYLIEMSHNNK